MALQITNSATEKVLFCDWLLYGSRLTTCSMNQLSIRRAFYFTTTFSLKENPQKVTFFSKLINLLRLYACSFVHFENALWIARIIDLSIGIRECVYLFGQNPGPILRHRHWLVVIIVHYSKICTYMRTYLVKVNGLNLLKLKILEIGLQWPHREKSKTRK